MSNGTAVTLDTKPEVITFGVIADETPDGTHADGTPKTKITLRAASRENDLEKARKDGNLIIEQSFAYDKAGTLAGISQVVDSEEAVLTSSQRWSQDPFPVQGNRLADGS